MKIIILFLMASGFFGTANAQTINVQTAAGVETVKVESLGCGELEYTDIQLISRNTVDIYCRPVLCKIKPRAYFLGSNSDFEITRFDGDKSTYITQTQHKKDLKAKVQELIDAKVCKTFQIFDLLPGKWPVNAIW